MEFEATLGPIVGTIQNNHVRILFESTCKRLDIVVKAGNQRNQYTIEKPKLITESPGSWLILWT